MWPGIGSDLRVAHEWCVRRDSCIPSGESVSCTWCASWVDIVVCIIRCALLPHVAGIEQFQVVVGACNTCPNGHDFFLRVLQEQSRNNHWCAVRGSDRGGTKIPPRRRGCECAYTRVIPSPANRPAVVMHWIASSPEQAGGPLAMTTIAPNG